MLHTIQLMTRFEPSEAKTFQHIPFAVPDNVQQMHISITYNDRIDSSPTATGGNTLDIGLFDEQGTESGGPGFRGWGGSVRTEITLDNSWATPPYRAGNLNPGTWTLLLGAYKVGENGMDVDVTVSFGTNHEPPDLPPVASLSDLSRPLVSPVAEPNWYRGDLHMHTVYSDGDSYPHEIAAAAYTNGLDFYGITDHNRAQSPVDLVPHGDGWPVLVPGVEVTTYAGHFNVWGKDEWYDFRDPTPEGIQAAVNSAREHGGLLSLNHPKPFGPPWEFPEVDGFDCIESWNGWWGRLNNLSTAFWADKLTEGGPDSWHVGVGGSDMHKLASPGTSFNPLSHPTIGYPTLWIQTDEPLSSGSILEAIRAGRCFVSESPAGPQIYARREDNRIAARVIGADGDALLAVGPEGTLAAIAINEADAMLCWKLEELNAGESPQFVRFELHTPTGGIRALSNPIWLTP